MFESPTILSMNDLKAKNLAPFILTTDNVEGPDAKAALPQLNEYFKKFLPPSHKCVRCGTTQGGLEGAIMGGFVYGIAHGEGRCGTCGYPGRANHYVKYTDEQGNTHETNFNFILQYHPDLVTGDK